MPQKITKPVMQMVAEAKAAVEEFEAADAVKLQLNADPGVVLIDLRDPRELERDGKVPGAKHVTRGMLEFWIDPASPYHKSFFAEDKKFVFFCAGGWRSALAAKTAKEMGLQPFAHIIGVYKALKDPGGPFELPPSAPPKKA